MPNEKYKDYPKRQYFNGLVFCRDDHYGYYRHSNKTGERPFLMHRYVWEFYNGEIPSGYDVHHKDGNKSNNKIENLELIDRHEHHVLHGKHLSEKQYAYLHSGKGTECLRKAAEWHRSEDGREWHRKHALEDCGNWHRESVEIVCQQCGNKSVKQIGGRFCSNACKSKWRRDHHLDDIDVECCECHTIFRKNKYAVKPGKKQFCSRKCAGRDRSRLMIGNVNGRRKK